MDAVYDALDTFTRASTLATGVDIEIEAQAEAMIGKVLYKLLAKPEKAKRHLYDSVLLQRLKSFEGPRPIFVFSGVPAARACLLVRFFLSCLAASPTDLRCKTLPA